uniref:C-type lectin domain-containing protein n=1 Tax=Panagrolaimus davidi TaxID=227884 RepID=A0A914PPF1_9BILA
MICQKNGGHLASIHDAFTNVIIGQNAPVYFHRLWIGANSLTTKNVWEWTDGSNFDFIDWRKGEPKNTSDSMCASVFMNDGYWSAESCFTYKPFVCEILNTDTITTTMKTTAKTLSSITAKTTITSVRTTSTVTDATYSPPSLPVVQNCDSGWTYFAPTNSFYCGNYSSYLTWSESEKYCNSIGGHLTSVHSDLENRLILAFVKYMGCGGQAPWLGLYPVDNGTTYQWTDGSNFDYQKWYNSYINAGTCIILNGFCTDDIWGFENMDCSQLWGVICKKA